MIADPTTPVACPQCAGLSQPDHPAGVLGGWHHTTTCPLLVAEDSRREADQRLLASGLRTRPATTTESRLLSSYGVAVPVDVTTRLTALTPSVIRRSWPEIGVS